jgi:DNA-binding NarL/FixJ family response regulator
MTIRVAAVDDHPLVLVGISALLRDVNDDVQLETVAHTVQQLLDDGRSYDIVLLDMRLGDGIEPAENVAALTQAGARVLMLTTETRPVPLRSVIEAGAFGIIPKNEPPERIVEAILEAHEGRHVASGLSANALINGEAEPPRLTGRQLEIVSLLAEGLPRKAIARRLGISVATVNEHYNRTVEQLRASGDLATNAVSVVSRALRDGYLDPPGSHS